MEQIVLKEKKNRDCILTFKSGGLNDYTDVLKMFELNLKMNVKYSFLIRVCYLDEKSGEHTQYKMLGNQIGVTLRSFVEMKNFAIELYNVINQRLQYGMDNYDFRDFDVVNVQILTFSLGDVKVSKTIRVNRKTFINEKGILNTSSILSNIKDIGIKPDVSNYGVLLERTSNSIKLTNGNIMPIKDIIYKYNKYIQVKFNDNTKFYEKSTLLGDTIYVVNKTDNLLDISSFSLKGMHIIDVTFELLDNGDYIRKQNNVKLYLNNKGVYKKEIDIKFPLVYAQKESGKVSRMIQPDWRIGVLDLETYVNNDKSYTYAVGYCVKDKVKTFYIDKDLNSDNLIIQCLNSMLVETYNGYTFYTHNLTNYDIYFIFKVVVSRTDLYTYDINFRDEKIIGLKISRKLIGKSGRARVYSIKIVDSYNMLQIKLSKLCTLFDTSVNKGHFPYGFVSRNTIFYKGNKPDISYYNDRVPMFEEDKIDVNTYNNITNNWCLQAETIKYLEQDLISLYQVMDRFNRKVYIDYHIHASQSLTISSLSMEIFLRRFYKNNIPLIKQKAIYNDIKCSYYGGITEVYKPYGKNLYYYDVNSLYPFSALNPMPGSDCIYTDNINKLFHETANNYFGFYYCVIETSKQYFGLLPVRTKEGLTMPTGKFEGWYFSEELRYAAENGYNIKVIRGYTFNKVYNVFDDYIKKLYSIKRTTKNEAERQIVKSLLNNLLGRFGLDINKYSTTLVNEDEFKELLQTRKLRGVKFVDDKILLSYNQEVDRDICMSHDLDYKEAINDSLSSVSEGNIHNVSVAISSAVTSYSRVFMNKIKMNILNKGGSIYYTDTDSIVTDIELDEKHVGKDLGQFKLEHKISEGCFVSSKTYAYKTVTSTGEEKLITKNKGVYRDTLDFNKFMDMYRGKEVKGTRYVTHKSFGEGSAIINKPEAITLYPNSYNKRVKIYKNNVWVDTKPINRKIHTSSQIKKDRLLTILSLFFLSITFCTLVHLYINGYIDFNIINSINNIEELNNISVPDLIEVVNTKSEKGIFENFIDKFKPSNRHSYNIEYYKQDMVNNLSLQEDKSMDKPNIIDSIHKYYIYNLDLENSELKDKISKMEIELQRNRIRRLEWNRMLEEIIDDLETKTSRRSTV